MDATAPATCRLAGEKWGNLLLSRTEGVGYPSPLLAFSQSAVCRPAA